MDTIETTMQVAAKSRELDFAKRQLLQDLADSLNEFMAAKLADNYPGMDYARGKYMGLLAGLLYTGSIAFDEHYAHTNRMIEAIKGGDDRGHL